ncbi:MAG: thiol peroxidase [Paramuribaculum sp.]|nr:thiol peroxidase [Paramuribaculum sp.]MDE7470670.1 thiol peroxidase [Paramuribaculum sp.]
METIYLKGTPCHTYGSLPEVGTQAPCFHLTGADLSNVQCNDFKDKTVVLNIFPSLDTEVCARSVRRFNEEASKLEDTVVICVSMDLPFAMGRFCTTEGIKDVIPASAFRSPLFGQKFGVQICDGPLAGLLARAVIIIDRDRNIAYRELVEEITNEPDYDAALRVLKGKF